jgi:hypothetical protein
MSSHVHISMLILLNVHNVLEQLGDLRGKFFFARRLCPKVVSCRDVP